MTIGDQIYSLVPDPYADNTVRFVTEAATWHNWILPQVLLRQAMI